MNAVSADTVTVSYDDNTGKYTISSDGAVTFELLWATGVSGSGGTDTHIGTLLGYDDSSDDTAAFSYEGENPI